MRPDGQTDHSCSINKRSHTSWKCTNKARWSDRSFMLKEKKVTYTLEMQQGKMVRGHSCSINQRSHTCWKCTNKTRWSDRSFMLNQQKGHILPGDAPARPDGQTGHSCSINKRSHTSWKCTNKARWSDRSFMLNQKKKVTYTLEMQKRGEMVRQVIHAQSTKGHIQTRLLGKSSITGK